MNIKSNCCAIFSYMLTLFYSGFFVLLRFFVWSNSLSNSNYMNDKKNCHSCSLTEQKTGVEHFLQRFVFQYAYIVLMHVCTFFVALTFKYEFYAGMHFFSHSIDCFFLQIFFYARNFWLFLL